MGSFTSLTYHIVFATKHRNPCITDAVRESLYEYIGGIIRSNKGCQLEIGGVEDHVHILARLSPAIAVSDAIRDLKANSSGWLRERRDFQKGFAWQKGYGAFSVSYSNVDSVRQYIRNQPEHHCKLSFKDEYIQFLRVHDIDFKMEYLFEDEFGA